MLVIFYMIATGSAFFQVLCVGFEEKQGRFASGGADGRRGARRWISLVDLPGGSPGVMLEDGSIIPIDMFSKG